MGLPNVTPQTEDRASVDPGHHLALGPSSLRPVTALPRPPLPQAGCTLVIGRRHACKSTCLLKRIHSLKSQCSQASATLQSCREPQKRRAPDMQVPASAAPPLRPAPTVSKCSLWPFNATCSQFCAAVGDFGVAQCRSPVWCPDASRLSCDVGEHTCWVTSLRQESRLLNQQNTGWAQVPFPGVREQSGVVLVLLFTGYCIIFRTNDCKPTFAPRCTLTKVSLNRNIRRTSWRVHWLTKVL